MKRFLLSVASFSAIGVMLSLGAVSFSLSVSGQATSAPQLFFASRPTAADSHHFKNAQSGMLSQSLRRQTFAPFNP